MRLIKKFLGIKIWSYAEVRVTDRSMIESYRSRLYKAIRIIIKAGQAFIVFGRQYASCDAA